MGHFWVVNGRVMFFNYWYLRCILRKYLWDNNLTEMGKIWRFSRQKVDWGRTSPFWERQTDGKCHKYLQTPFALFIKNTKRRTWQEMYFSTLPSHNISLSYRWFYLFLFMPPVVFLFHFVAVLCLTLFVPYITYYLPNFCLLSFSS